MDNIGLRTVVFRPRTATQHRPTHFLTAPLHSTTEWSLELCLEGAYSADDMFKIIPITLGTILHFRAIVVYGID